MIVQAVARIPTQRRPAVGGSLQPAQRAHGEVHRLRKRRQRPPGLQDAPQAGHHHHRLQVRRRHEEDPPVPAARCCAREAGEPAGERRGGAAGRGRGEEADGEGHAAIGVERGLAAHVDDVQKAFALGVAAVGEHRAGEVWSGPGCVRWAGRGGQLGPVWVEGEPTGLPGMYGTAASLF
jgi:hypothetical protein